MFYSNDKIIEYPNKSVLQDVLSRDGLPTEYSFTPFSGCKHIIQEQLGIKSNEIDLKELLRGSKDFAMDKAKANDDKDREFGTSQVVDYYTKLEDVDQHFIDKYAQEVVVGYKINRKGLRKYEEEMRVLPMLYDAESEAYVSISDLEERKMDFSTEEILEAKNKLPYLLRQLHYGSIMYKGSLLSFIIAAEKCFKQNENNPGYQLVPRDIVGKCVYRMDRDGNITTKFDISQNTGEILRTLIAWTCGKIENDVYYKAYTELLRVLTILDLDITNEDARKYDHEFIRSMVCTYLATNEEYLESYGFADRKILSMLSPENLFRVAARVSDSDVTPERVDVNILADSIATNTETLKLKNISGWKDNIPAVNKFLAFYCNMLKVPVKTVKDYTISKGLLRKHDGTYVTVNVTKIAVGRNFGQVLAVVSISGKLIIVEEFESVLRYLDVETAIDYFGGYDNGKEWDYLNL